MSVLEKFTLSSKDEGKNKFIFLFKTEDDENITVTVKEENSNFPKYEHTFRREEFIQEKQTRVAIKENKMILKELRSSFENNKCTFIIKDSEIIFSYFIFQIFEIKLSIPIIKKNINDSIKDISSAFLHFNKLSDKYNKIIRKILANLSKRKNNIHLFLQKNQLINENEISVNLFNNLLIQQKKEMKKIHHKLSSIGQNFEENKTNFELPEDQKVLINHIFRPIEDPAKIETIYTIKGKKKVTEICFLKDGRLVSGEDLDIVIYKLTNYRPDFVIKDPHGSYDGDNKGKVIHVTSVCGLRDGGLASSGSSLYHFDIRVWKIEGDKYTLLHTLEGHKSMITGIMEMEDGKICSISDDKTIRVWDNKNNFNCFKTLKGHESFIEAIIELDEIFVSVSDSDERVVRTWIKPTFEECLLADNFYCYSKNAIAKLKKNLIIIGGHNKVFIVEFLATKGIKGDPIKNKEFGGILSICAMRNGKILIGNEDGNMICFEYLSEVVIFKKKIHKDEITCIVETEDNKLFSSSKDNTINIYN